MTLSAAPAYFPTYVSSRKEKTISVYASSLTRLCCCTDAVPKPSSAFQGVSALSVSLLLLLTGFLIIGIAPHLTTCFFACFRHNHNNYGPHFAPVGPTELSLQSHIKPDS